MADQDYGQRDPLGDQTQQGDPDAQPSAGPARESGAEFDPLRTGQIPTEATGEQRWMRRERDRLGPVDDRDWSRGQADAMGAAGRMGPDAQQDQVGTGGDPNMPGGAAPDQGQRAGGASDRTDEAYGRGVTEQFTPTGEESGIEQERDLEAQERERQGDQRRGDQRRGGVLGAIGDALGGLFGGGKKDEGQQ